MRVRHQPSARRRAIALVALILTLAQVPVRLAFDLSLSVSTAAAAVAIMACSLWGALAAGDAARADVGRHRLSWRCTQLVCAFSLLVAGAMTVRLTFGGEPPIIGDDAVFSICFTVAPAIGTLLLMPPNRDRWLRLRAALESVAMGAALSIIAWNYFLRSAFDASTMTDELKMVAVGGAILTICRLTITVMALERSRDPLRKAQRPSFVSMVVACLAATTIELVIWRNYLLGDPTAQLASFASWLVALVAGAISAHLWRPLPDSAISPSSQHAGSGLPYGVVLITLVFMAPVILDGGMLDPTSTILSTLMAAAMLARQFVMLRENIALARELEMRVDARTAEVAARDRFRVLVQNSSDVVMAVSDELVITYASQSVERLLGKPVHHVIGMKLDTYHSGELVALVDAIEKARLTGGSPVPVEWSLRHEDGHLVHVESLVAHLPEDPSVKGFVINSRDITDRRALEDQLTHQAFHDTLTNLPNRALFKDRLNQSLTRFDRFGERFAVLFCDLDAFKAINDSVGHGVGDELLVEVARRLQASVRAGDTVARFGGDEFALLLEAVDDDEIAIVAQRVVNSLQVPVRINEEDLFIGTSVGVVVGDRDGNHNVDDLLRNADLAMYVAKSLGKNRYVRFEPSMHDRFLSELDLKNDLRRAVFSEDMVLHYQPILELQGQRIVSVEALVRWNHPTRGMVPPMDFIPLCEETGIIVELGRWVLETACLQLATWQRLHPDTAPDSVSVNLSGRQLQNGDIVDTVQQVLALAGLDANHLTLEVTESVLLEDVEGVLAQLKQLQDLGVRLAIDDFGTGYSSLNYLRHFPIDILKIDRSFVSGIGKVEQDSVLANAITTLGRMLEMKTVAEGIEEPEELEALKAMGCDMGQGYYFARPIDAEGMEGILAGAPQRHIDV